MFRLIITAPDGTVTENHPVRYGAHVALAVSHTLRAAAPWMDRRTADRYGLNVSRQGHGVDRVHMGTGYKFRIETED